MPRYRANVAALIVNPKGKILVCERSGQNGAWQFPQGGVDKGESSIEALYREVLEEVGLPPTSYDAVEYIEGYRYDFPESKKRSKGYDGQEQTYYLCVLHKGAPEPDINYDADEFQENEEHFEV